ncbi:MAG: hypothetical protein V4736_15190 [Bdellovibrionota bacterium]
MRTIALLSALLISYFVYGFYLSQIDFSVVTAPEETRQTPGSFKYKGVLNVLSSRSQGSARPEGIIMSAKNAGLDYVVFTDLPPGDNSQLLKGYSGTTVLMDAQRVSYLDSRMFFLTANGIDEGMSESELQVKVTDYVTQIKPLPNFVSILSLPLQANFPTENFPPGVHGIEVVNVREISMKAWQESKLNVIWSLLIYPFNYKLAFLRLFNEPDEHWAYFDRVAVERQIVAFGGSEASARAFPWSNFLLRFPSYQRIFEMMSQHVILRSELTGIYSDDFEKILEAFIKGHFFICMDILGDPQGFSVVMKDDKKKYLMGDKVEFKKNLLMEFSLPEPKTFFEVILWRNGEKYKIFNTHQFDLPIKEPGVYRLQVRVSPYLPLPDAKKWMTWIYTNPFFVE